MKINFIPKYQICGGLLEGVKNKNRPALNIKNVKNTFYEILEQFCTRNRHSYSVYSTSKSFPNSYQFFLSTTC